MRSRRKLVITFALAVLAALAIWWWLGTKGDDEDATVASAEAAKLAGKRPVGAGTDETDGPPELHARWQSREASVAGTVREKSSGSPIPNADVCAWIGDDTAPSQMKREPVCTTSGADGRYLISDLPPLQMVVSASAVEHIPGSYEAHAGDARFQLRRGQAKVGADIELVKGGVAVKGIVKDVSGGVIEGAFVSNEWYGWNDGPTFGRARTKTDDKGEFQLWLGKGGATISATAEGYAHGSNDGTVPGHVFEILLTPESVLAGIVVRAGTGTPVANVRVSANGEWSWDGTGGEAYTDASGRFRIDRLGPGRYKPAARASDGYGRSAQSVHLGLGQSAEDLRIELHPAVSIRGRIVASGESRTPCEEGSASMRDKQANRSYWAETQVDGAIEFLAVLPGTYEVEVWCRGKLPRSEYAAITVGTEPIAELVWEVDEGLALTGIVVGPRGEPIERARVSVQLKSVTTARGQVGGAWGEPTGADGRFRASGLVEGTYSVRASVGEQPLVPPIEPTEAEVAAGKTTDVEIVLEAAGTVEGRVVDANDRPVADAEVSMRGDEAQWGANGSTRDDGTFTIESVRPQTYRVTASIGWGHTMRAPGTKDDDVQGERVTVTAGETAKVELVVEDRSGTIVGRVVDEAGGPIDDAFVHANRESDSARKSEGSNRGSARWGSWDREPVLTDQDGRFELTGLSPGNHTLFATRRGGGEGVAEHVEVGTREAVVRIAPGAAISGTVTLSSGGAPTRFDVTVTDRANGFDRREEFYETGGQWTLDDLPPGNYEISVDATEGRDTDTTKLGEGEQKSGVALVLEPKVDVEGTVVDIETGEPVPNIAVSISPRRGGMSFFMNSGGAKENVTDADGKFTVVAAPTGKVRVMLMPRSWGDETYGWNTLGATIPSDAQRHTLPALRIAKSRMNRNKRPGDLGFTLKETPPDLDMEDFPITVAFIRPGGPAAATELAIGDVITAVDGHDVVGENRHRWNNLSRVAQGTKITLELQSGKSIEITTGKPP